MLLPLSAVIPAKAGIQYELERGQVPKRKARPGGPWMPVCTGMTGGAAGGAKETYPRSLALGYSPPIRLLDARS